jgi:curved DNA-binding protein CbpA
MIHSKTMDGFFSSRKCPYNTLGVEKTASHDEIKAAFRKLSKETHPDVAATTGAADRFKEISHAASILTNPKKRKLYDESVEKMFRSSPYANMKGRTSSSSSSSNQYQRSGAMASLLRPRNFILGPIALFATVSAVQYVIGPSSDSEKYHGQNAQQTPLVQAWLNPETKRYETPAPWDPVYRRLKPELEDVPRDQVHQRSR